MPNATISEIIFYSVLLTFPSFAVFAQCPPTLINPAIGQPKLNTLRLKTSLIGGRVSDLTPGSTVQLCFVRNGKLTPVISQPIIADGTFSIKPPATLQVGDKISVQVVVAGPPVTYGRESDIAEIPESCEASTTVGEKPTTLKITDNGSGSAIVSGKILSPKGKTVRVCVNDVPQKDKPPLNSDGSFKSAGLKLEATDEVRAQVVTTNSVGKEQYGAVSEQISIPNPSAVTPSGFRYIFIVGIEESSYSSLSLNTDPFVYLYLEGNERRYPVLKYTQPWGRIRILGAPQPSTNGIGSTFADPTGTITKQDFTKIGQSIDIVGGTQIFLGGESADDTHTRVGAVAWAGTTTPLSSQDVTYMFKTPAASTPECSQLLSRFTPANGYGPGLTPDPSGKVCAVNGPTAVMDIAFANQDRTNFLFKWGAGIRIQGTENCTESREKCLPALAMLDATIGQDAAITGGQVRNFVAKAEGVLPIRATKNFVYLFGSVYTRLQRNQNYPPLILAAETNKPSLPSPTVVILPLRQPNRDFFRIGIGLNLNQVFSKFSGSAE